MQPPVLNAVATSSRSSSDDLYVHLGSVVSQYRKAIGWSQAELAERVSTKVGKKLDPTAITRIESGRRPVAAHELAAFSELFDVAVGEFFEQGSPIGRAISAAQVRIEHLLARKEHIENEIESARAYEMQVRLLTYIGHPHFTYSDLAQALTFLIFGEEVAQRPGWREILLSAGASNEVIESALERSRVDATLVTGPGNRRTISPFASALTEIWGASLYPKEQRTLQFYRQPPSNSNLSGVQLSAWYRSQVEQRIKALEADQSTDRAQVPKKLLAR